MAAPQPYCPLREEPCSICQQGATGPADCGLLWLVMDDEELRAEYIRRRQAAHPSGDANSFSKD